MFFIGGTSLTHKERQTLNICLVNNLYPPINTGSSYYTECLAKNLSKRGHRIVVITNHVASMDFVEIIDEVKVYRLPVLKLPEIDLWMNFPHFNFTLFPSNFSRIDQILKEEKIEIIHQCNNIFDLVFASARFSQKLRIPLVCSIMTQVQHSNPIYNLVLEWFDKLIIGIFFVRHVSRFIALDKESHRYIRERFGERSVSSVPFSIPREDAEFAFQNRKTDYDTTFFKVISVGHVSNLKDRLETIQAWKLVTTKFPNAKLVIVGGVFNKKSARLIKKLRLESNIEFTGRVPHDEVLNLMRNVDFSCMFLSSNLPFHAGVGAANLESMAFGLPVVLDATDDFFGEKFRFRSGEHYIRAANREPETLATTFIKLFENPELRKKVGHGGQEFVLETIRVEKTIDETELAYRSVLDEFRYIRKH